MAHMPQQPSTDGVMQAGKANQMVVHQLAVQVRQMVQSSRMKTLKNKKIFDNTINKQLQWQIQAYYQTLASIFSKKRLMM